MEYRELKHEISRMPIIDTHEHYTYTEQDTLLPQIILDYAYADFLSAASLGYQDLERALTDEGISLEEKILMLDEIEPSVRYTSYGKMLRKGLELICSHTGNDRKAAPFSQLLRTAIDTITTKTPQEWDALLRKESRITTKIVDQFDTMKFHRMITGQAEKPESDLLSFPLPSYHHLVDEWGIRTLETHTDTHIPDLKSYITTLRDYLITAVEAGICAVKDQSAYYRSLNYRKPSRGEAERVFDSLRKDPKAGLSPEDQVILDDYLFHACLRIIGELGIPFQVHTGHMAGIKNDVKKANAINFLPVLDEYSHIHFDLFHGNWPYLEEYLFIGKNYPNVSLDMCWVHAIDPAYSKELIKRVVHTIPVNKLLGFGGDTFHPCFTLAYEEQAVDTIASALHELTVSGWIGSADALDIARMMLFENPAKVFSIDTNKMN